MGAKFEVIRATVEGVDVLLNVCSPFTEKTSDDASAVPKVNGEVSCKEYGHFAWSAAFGREGNTRTKRSCWTEAVDVFRESCEEMLKHIDMSVNGMLCKRIRATDVKLAAILFSL